jgi:hypothetical protein
LRQCDHAASMRLAGLIGHTVSISNEEST